ncbi:MAG TPA: sulfite exporter TauE/SafE family protein [Candidatus Acidoferrum sp.]|nr:sulfite exporter TauE/SafE family protein [Candidatus Acidoferrum sp.]
MTLPSLDLWTAFVLGLVGSLHCAGMCGPLALALPAAGASTPGYVLGRVAYNLGRIVTYCLLGIVFGLAGWTLLLAGIQRWTCIGLGLVLLLSLAASRRLVRWSPVTLLVEWLKGRMSGLLRRRSFASLAALGLLNGLLPCGLVYAACAGAAATSGILAGARYMAVFGAGTIPMMLALSLSGRLVPVGLRLKLRSAIPVCVGLLGALLIVRGMGLGIPYVSPDMSGGAPSCCHK